LCSSTPAPTPAAAPRRTRTACLTVTARLTASGCCTVAPAPGRSQPTGRKQSSSVPGADRRPGHPSVCARDPAPLRHANFRQRFWLPALRSAGLPLIHFHDLRHTGNMLAAGAGAGLRELMERMGHSTTRAALTYLHANDDRQRAIASALSKISAGELKRRGPGRSGTLRARKRRKPS
jgi:hypothetical protein